jgi:hypothetical protein
MGQWSAGGMTMVGRMFDDGLRARVAALCSEIAAILPEEGFTSLSTGGRPVGAGEWWPGGLGRPSSTGSQDGMRYAYFPETRRLAIEEGSGVAVYDTGEHHISGVSQSNGALRFTGPSGAVAVERLRRIDVESDAETPAAPEPAPAAAPPPQPAPAPKPAPTADTSGGDILGTIERLADLHARGVLTAPEFQAKKAELLARL